MSIFLLLRGSCTLSITAQHRTAAMNLCMQMSIPYTNFVWREDGGIQFDCSVSSARKLLAACHKQEIEAEILACVGIPKLLKRLRVRVGLVVGAVLAIALVVLSKKLLS